MAGISVSKDGRILKYVYNKEEYSTTPSKFYYIHFNVYSSTNQFLWTHEINFSQDTATTNFNLCRVSHAHKYILLCQSLGVDSNIVPADMENEL